MWLRADAIRFSVQTDNYTAAFEYIRVAPWLIDTALSAVCSMTPVWLRHCVWVWAKSLIFCWAVEDDKEFKSLAALSSQLPSALLLWPFLRVRVRVHVMYVASFTYYVHCLLYLYIYMYMLVHAHVHACAYPPPLGPTGSLLLVLAQQYNYMYMYILWCVLTLID